MALPATDAFTSGSDVNLTAYSANWVMNTGVMRILAANDQVQPWSDNAESAARWEADAFNADQYSQAVCKVNSDSVAAMGVGVRHAAGGTDTYYLYYSVSTESYLYKNVAGTLTQLGSSGAAFVVNSTYRLEASGTTITPKKDGSTADIGAQTDESIASGAAGLTGYNDSTNSRVDDWEGGNLGGSALTGTVNQVTETDLAQAIARLKQKLLGQNAETDTAQAVAKSKQKAVGQNTETDSAQAFTAQKVVAVNQATETDAAQAFTVAGPITVEVGQVTETDSAQAVAKSKQKAVGQNTETDSAQAVTAQRVYGVGQVTEMDAAQAVASSKVREVGQAEETDEALSFGTQIFGTVNQVTETDAAQGMTVSKQKAVGQSTETDSAQSITPAHAYAVGQATETDSAFGLAISKQKTIGQASETDSALAFGTTITEQVGQVSETDSALAVSSAKVQVLGIAAEADSVFAIGAQKLRGVGQVSETDAALSITWEGANLITVEIGQAVENEYALDIRPLNVHTGLRYPKKKRATLDDWEPLDGLVRKRKGKWK